jgi:hypothetical protein
MSLSGSPNYILSSGEEGHSPRLAVFTLQVNEKKKDENKEQSPSSTHNIVEHNHDVSSRKDVDWIAFFLRARPRCHQ